MEGKTVMGHLKWQKTATITHAQVKGCEYVEEMWSFFAAPSLAHDIPEQIAVM